MKKMKKASGGAVGSHRADPRPMSLADRIKESRARTSEAIGDTPPKPKPKPKPAKPEAYAMGGPVGAGIPPQRGSVAQAGPTAGAGIQNIMPNPTPRPSDFRVGPLQFGQAGSFDNPLNRMLRGNSEMVPPKMKPSLPGAVGPGGGYKKGGRVDGCATRGKTKGAKK